MSKKSSKSSGNKSKMPKSFSEGKKLEKMDEKKVFLDYYTEYS